MTCTAATVILTHVDPAEGVDVDVWVGAQMHTMTDAFERSVSPGFGTADAGWRWEGSRQGTPTGSVGNHTGYLPVGGVQGAGVDLSAPITELLVVGRLQDCSTNPYGPLTVTSDVWVTSGAPGAPTIALAWSGQTLFGTEPLEASATDDVAVTAVDLLVDGSVVATLATEPYLFELDTTAFADGAGRRSDGQAGERSSVAIVSRRRSAERRRPDASSAERASRSVRSTPPRPTTVGTDR